jgi:uncharacterized pyridoxal phosphate-containing UPF0001 family protein
MSVAENIRHIREKIIVAADKSGRAPGDIKLVAVTKTATV